MTISTDIINNKTELSLKVNKAVVDYIKRNKQTNGSKSPIKTKELLKVAYNCIGVSDEILATEEIKVAVSNCVKTCLTVLEEVKAIKPMAVLPTNFVEYLEFKKGKSNKQQKPIHGKAISYEISSDFNKKVSALKTNEIILGSDVISVDLENRNVSVLSVRDVKFDKIKFCNSMFNYTKYADYIGCYNEETGKVDFVSTAPERMVFFCNDKKHVLPEKREIINLYYLVNLSPYKKIFHDETMEGPVQTILSLRAQQKPKTLSTDNFKLSNATSARLA